MQYVWQQTFLCGPVDQTLSRCASQLIGSNAVTLREPAYWIKRCHAARASLLNQTLSRCASQLIESNAVTLRETAYL